MNIKSIRHHSKSYDFENNNKKRQKPKFSRKVREECVDSKILVKPQREIQNFT